MGFNRTFMELKQRIAKEYAERPDRFNRTFMELKLSIETNIDIKSTRFNRTFMELKLGKNVTGTGPWHQPQALQSRCHGDRSMSL